MDGINHKNGWIIIAIPTFYGSKPFDYSYLIYKHNPTVLDWNFSYYLARDASQRSKRHPQDPCWCHTFQDGYRNTGPKMTVNLEARLTCLSTYTCQRKTQVTTQGGNLHRGWFLMFCLHIKYVTLTVEMPLAATLSQQVAVFGKCPRSSKTIQSPKVNHHYWMGKHINMHT